MLSDYHHTLEKSGSLYLKRTLEFRSSLNEIHTHASCVPSGVLPPNAKTQDLHRIQS